MTIGKWIDVYKRQLGDRTIQVAFSTGEVVEVDFNRGFDGPVFQPLMAEDTLKEFSIQHGVLTWADGAIDVAPEYLLSVGKLIEGAVTA